MGSPYGFANTLGTKYAFTSCASDSYCSSRRPPGRRLGRDCESLARAEHAAGLSEAPASRDEVVRSCRVELEHVVVAGDGEPRSTARSRGPPLTAVHVSELTVDRQEGDVERKRAQPLAETCVRRRVAGVVERPPAHSTTKPTAPPGTSWSAGTAVKRKPPTATVSSKSTNSGATPARSNASVSQSAGQTSARGRSACSVSASRWSVWLWLEVTTSTKSSARRVDDPSRHAHVRLVGVSGTSPSASPRGTGRAAGSGPSSCTRNPLCPSHQRCSAPARRARATRRRRGRRRPRAPGSITRRAPRGPDRDALDQVRELLPRRPARGLAQPAVGREGQPLGRRVAQEAAHALARRPRRLDVVALDVDDADGDVRGARRSRRRSRTSANSRLAISTWISSTASSRNAGNIGA